MDADGMAKPKKPFHAVDWDRASEHLIGAFPESSLAEVVARAERAAVTLDQRGSHHEAEAMRRVAAHIRRRLFN